MWRPFSSTQIRVSHFSFQRFFSRAKRAIHQFTRNSTNGTKEFRDYCCDFVDRSLFSIVALSKQDTTHCFKAIAFRKEIVGTSNRSMSFQFAVTPDAVAANP
jgi:hypothetical protein